MSTCHEVKPAQSETISHWGEPRNPQKVTMSYNDAKFAMRGDEPYFGPQNVPTQQRAKEGTLLYRQLNSKAFATQVGGSHYKKHAIQPTEYSMANALDACQSNVVKYITRFRDKGGAKDLRKVLHYVEYLLETEYPGE